MAGVGGGKNDIEEELNQLCYNVLHVSQDPTVGNGQRAERLWDSIAEHYNHHRPKDTEMRAKKSLEGKWQDIKQDVSKFIGYYQQVESRQTSGTNQDDTLKASRELYRENHLKSTNFGYESAWSILKDCPQWQPPADDMARPKKTEKLKISRGSSSMNDCEIASPQILPTSDDEADRATNSTNVNNQARRPIGTKRAKEEVKRAKMPEDVMRMSAEAQKEQAATTKDFMSQWKLEEAMNLKRRMQQTSQEVNPPPI